MRAVEHPQKSRGSPDRGSPIPPVSCDHDRPILLLAADHGRRRGFCPGCKSVGPIRESSWAAQCALIDTRTRQRPDTRGRKKAQTLIGAIGAKSMRPGSRVRVHECPRRPTLEGLEGTISKRYGGDKYLALEVRLDDDGGTELFRPYELQEKESKV